MWRTNFESVWVHKHLHSYQITETLITPEQFAQVLCDDLDLPTSNFVPAISQSIRQQVEQFSSDMIPQDEEDRRVIIKVRRQ